MREKEWDRRYRMQDRTQLISIWTSVASGGYQVDWQRAPEMLSIVWIQV